MSVTNLRQLQKRFLLDNKLTVDEAKQLVAAAKDNGVTRAEKLVDVPGPVGERGLWAGGQFISRADLGNWMMAVADQISVQRGNQLFKTDLSALDLLKGTTQFLMNNGGGVVADVLNDKKKGHKEVWNLPFISSDVTNKAMDAPTTAAILDLANKDHLTGGVAVKEVTIVGASVLARRSRWGRARPAPWCARSGSCPPSARGWACSRCSTSATWAGWTRCGWCSASGRRCCC